MRLPLGRDGPEPPLFRISVIHINHFHGWGKSRQFSIRCLFLSLGFIWGGRYQKLAKSSNSFEKPFPSDKSMEQFCLCGGSYCGYRALRRPHHSIKLSRWLFLRKGWEQFVSVFFSNQSPSHDIERCPHKWEHLYIFSPLSAFLLLSVSVHLVLDTIFS